MKQITTLVMATLTILAVSGCGAPVNVEPFAPMMRTMADMQMSLAAAVIHTEQTAGGDIYDPWIGRGAMAAGSIIFYMALVRPLRSFVIKKIKVGD